MTPVFTASPIQGHSGVIKRLPHQFLQAECVVAEAAAGSTTVAVISGSRYASSFLFLTHSNELLHYAPSFCNWTTCRLPAKQDLELKVRQPDARQAPLHKGICERPRSSLAVQALQTRQVCNVRSPAANELTQSLRRRMGVEATACVLMAAVQLVRRQHVRHHAGSTGRRLTTFVATFGLLRCSLDACFGDNGGRLTTSVSGKQCSSAPSKWPRIACYSSTHAGTGRAKYFAEPCDSTNVQLHSDRLFRRSVWCVWHRLDAEWRRYNESDGQRSLCLRCHQVVVSKCSPYPVAGSSAKP
ncbi:hypothetical protein HPB50_021551 [Hyalomma asiaticum]|uniref:Uncharacterized protein n=1 Tax=Hyalomma asiaticum TaxID=266040 RepID=A0ACB7TJT5_HYAAI|nr:hypothetical protein HPB50_021551 [Hyalomma asiaticum]